MTDSTSSDRRRHPRLHLGSPVEFVSGDHRMNARLANLSVRGAKVLLNPGEMGLKLGDLCTLISDGDTLTGTVAGVHPDGVRIIFT
jgi:hypothetical protein